MSPDQSLVLLARRLGRNLGEEEQPEALKLAELVGYLPIALDLAAARIARGKTWLELNQALSAEIARLEVLEAAENQFKKSKNEDRDRYRSLKACFNLSYVRSCKRLKC